MGLIQYENVMNMNGVKVPYFVVDGGLQVLSTEGVEKLIDAFFPYYPKDQLKNSQYYFEVGKHKGYLIEIIKQLYEYSPERDENFVSCLLTIGLSALVDDATKNTLTSAGSYSRLMNEELELTKAEVKKLDNVLLKAKKRSL